MEHTLHIAISDIKDRVGKMLLERHRISPEGTPEASFSTDLPSQYWSDFCTYFDYMLGLPEEAFLKLRLHTYHLTGDNYQYYYFGTPRMIEYQWQNLICNIPKDLVIEEPENGIGFDIDGKLISTDIMRFQQIIALLYKTNLYSDLQKRSGEKRNFVLEIGAGYGGMAHHFSKLVPNTTYVIVDLPETLIFSAAYLTLHNPDKRIYLYGEGDFAEVISPDSAKSYDFILMPNYRLWELDRLRFGFAINMASFQEMRPEQVNVYLDFLERTLNGVLYSWNQDAQPKNKEMTNVTQLLANRFILREYGTEGNSLNSISVRSLAYQLRLFLRLLAAQLGLLLTATPPPYRQYICERKQTL